MVHVAVFSDVHGNAIALRHALRHAKNRGCRQFMFAGDIVSKGPQPAETIDIVRGLDVPVVRGNNERRILAAIDGKRGDKISSWTAKRLDGAQRDWLRGLPHEWEGSVGGHRIRMVHGSDRCDEDPVYPSITAAALTAKVAHDRWDVFVCGHSHLPFLRRFGGRVAANAGSVGMPYDGDPRGSYLLLNLEEGGPPMGEVIRFEYPVEELVDMVVARRPPGVMVEGYRSGLRPVPPKKDTGPRAGSVAATHLMFQMESLRRSADLLLESEHPEIVHDVRVAARRARATLRVLRDVCPVTDDPPTGDLRWILKVAGAVRDLDVLIGRIRKEGTDAGLDDAAVATVIGHLQHHRHQEKALLIEAIRSERFGRLLQKMGLAAAGAVRDHDANPARSLAIVHVREAAKKVRSVYPKEPRRAREERLHDLRIAFKRLRYTLEVFAPAYPSGLEPELRAMKSLQDALGGLQDAAVAEDRLTRLLAEADDRSVGAALAALVQWEQARRKKARKNVVRQLRSATDVTRAAEWAVA